MSIMAAFFKKKKKKEETDSRQDFVTRGCNIDLMVSI